MKYVSFFQEMSQMKKDRKETCIYLVIAAEASNYCIKNKDAKSAARIILNLKSMTNSN